MYIPISQLFIFFAVIAHCALGNRFDKYYCPDYQDWGNWTNQCLWFPLNNIRDGIIESCDMKVNSTLPSLPVFIPATTQCGHCSFKARCRKREIQDGCFPVDLESRQCAERSTICQLPKLTELNLTCSYDYAYEYFKQCNARSDLQPWIRNGISQAQRIMPDINCKEKDDQCFCCCHPYYPNEDATECVQNADSQCEDWNEWNDWSNQCIWINSQETRQIYSQHCDFDGPRNEMPEGVLTPIEEALNPAPARCGFCSYKIKCRKRSKLDKNGKKSCFPIEVEKKTCGNHDGENFGEVCDFPKYQNSCNYTTAMTRNEITNTFNSSLKKLPSSMKGGLLKIISLMQHGDCREVDDRCKCCCHPYILSEDAKSCVLKDICDYTNTLNIDMDLNLDRY